MSKKKLNKTVWYGSDVDLQGNAILPPLAESREDLNGIHEGEIYLHNQDDDPGIWVRTNKGNVKRIGFNKKDFDLSEYLKKQVWDTAWELRTTEEGESYIFCKLPFISQHGVTLYADGGNIDLPSLYAGIPVDGVTITKKEDGTLMLNPNLELGGLDEEALQKYLDDYNYAKLSDIPSLDGYAKITDVDNRINDLVNGAPAAYDTLKEIADVLQGNVNSIGDIITTLGTKADKTYVDTELAKYIPIAGDTEVTGIKNFLNGLKIGGLPISKYEGHDDVIYIDANVVLRGGLTQYAVDPVTIPSIIESLPQAGYESKGVASFSSEFFAIDANGKVSIIPDSVGLNEEELEAWLANSDYATKTYADDRYFLASNFTKVNIVAKLGISDWALAATKPSYTTKEVTEDTNLYFTNQRAIDALTDTLKSYVTLQGTQTIEGEKDFTGGLKVNGSPIVYDSENGYWLLQGNLLITGGLTQYVDDGSVDLPNLYDGLPIDGSTIYWDNGVLKAKVAEGGITSITDTMIIEALGYTPYDASNPNGYITSAALNGYATISGLATVATSGSYNDLSNKPTIPTNTNQLTNGAGFITSSALSSYLPLSGGTLTGDLILQSSTDSGSTPKLYFQRGVTNDDYYDYHIYDTGGELLIGYTDKNGSHELVNITHESFRPNKDNAYILGHNSYKWANLYTTLINGGTPIHSGNYSSYALPLSGGTLTSEGNTPLTLKSKLSETWIAYHDKNGFLGSIGITSSKTLYYYYDGSSKQIWHSGNSNLSSVDWNASKLILNTTNTTDWNVARGNNTIQLLRNNETAGNAPNTYSSGISIMTSYTGFQLATYGGNWNYLFFRSIQDNSTWLPWRTIAFTDSNVASATKLQTARTIWGRSFDGTGDVNGSMYFQPGSVINYYDENAKANKEFIRPPSGVSGGANLIIGRYNADYDYALSLCGKSMVMYTGSWGSASMFIDNSGNVGIGTTSPAYKLDVVGTGEILNISNTSGGDSGIRFSRGSNTSWTIIAQGGNLIIKDNYSNSVRATFYEVTQGGTISVASNFLAKGGITQYSDIRKKTKLNDVELTLKQVANAPLIEHYYNSDDKKTTHVGSIAQYWAEMNDWFCKLDNDGFYTMEIQNAALASAISVARELERYESKTDKKIRMLKKRINELEDEIEILKKGA